MIETARLRLRPWCDADAAAMHAIGQDPRVMATLGPLMDLDAARALVAGQIAYQSQVGHCFWPIERRADGRVLGFCGLKPGVVGTPLAGRLEIGWRLAFDVWGQGYAREAAAATLDWAWANTDRDLVLAITTPGNVRSWGLMERLGMSRVVDGDFDHPALTDGDPLRPHITYAIARPTTSAAAR